MTDAEKKELARKKREAAERATAEAAAAEAEAGDEEPTLLDEVRGALKTFRDEMTAEVKETVSGMLTDAGAGKPNRSTLAAIHDGEGNGDGRTSHEVERIERVRFAFEDRYRSLSPAMREVRNAETDLDMARWILGMTSKDHQTIREVEGKYRTPRRTALEAEWARATLAEGLADSSSGLGAGSGANLLPLPLERAVILERQAAAVMRSIVRIFTSESHTKRIPNSGIVVAAMVAEGAGGSQNEPTIGGTVLSKKKATANLAATIEEIEDSAFDLVSLFSERAGSAFGVIEDLQIATSNGTAPNISESLGSATITDVAEASAGVITYEDLAKLLLNVPKAYRPFVGFFGAADVTVFLSQMVDGNGRPQLQSLQETPSLSAEGTQADGSVLGRRYYELPLANGEIFCGPPQEYGMLDGGGISMRVLSETLASTDAILYRFTERFDGAVLTNAAWRQMTGITSVG